MAYYTFEEKLISPTLEKCHLKIKESMCPFDVTLIADSKKLESHKMVLEAESPYFRAMFCSDMKESKQDEIALFGVDFQALDCIIKFLYTGKIKLKEENIFCVVAAVDLLQMSCVRPFCDKFLSYIISPSNCLSIYIMSAQYGHHDVSNKAIHFAKENFSKVCKEDDFLQASYFVVSKLYYSRVLDVESIPQLVQAIHRWIKHDSSRECYRKDFATVKPSNILKTKYPLELCFAIGGMTYECDGEVPLRSIEMIQRSPGFRFTGSQLSLYGFTSRCTLIPPMQYCRVFPAIAIYDELIYVIGGSDGHEPIRQVECYKNNVWKLVPSLPYGLEGAAAACVNKRIYVTGGFSRNIGISNRVWYLDIGCSSWKETTPMLHRRSHHSLVNIYGTLYAIGGSDEKGNATNTVECFRPGQDCWIEAAPLQTPRSHLACVGVNDSIIAICGTSTEPLDTIERYSSVENKWEYVPGYNTFGRFFTHSAVLFCNRLFLIGGRSSNKNAIDTVQQLNVSCVNSMWTISDKLWRPRSGLVSATIKIY